MTLRRAALTAGFAYLINPVAYAESTLYPKLVIMGHADQTVHNISVNPAAFSVLILCYVINFVGDVVIAWALYALLAPVNRPLSLLAAIFQLVYTAVGLSGVMNLAVVYHLGTDADYGSFFSAPQLEGQVYLFLQAFRHMWSLSLVFFGIHLCLVGFLIFRSRYIPQIIGILLAIDGLAWIVDSFQPYFYARANLGFLFVAFLSELVFMLWLLIGGWFVKEPSLEAKPAVA